MENSDLIRMEMNIVISNFSRLNNLKTNQIKNIIFPIIKESYLEVVPRHGGIILLENLKREFLLP